MPNIDIVVFGRGNGESILVELEPEHWMVIDCFINPTTKEPAAISYLKSLKLDPIKVIKTIVITHFHEDHVKGMQTLISNSNPIAKVYMPDALTSKEAISYYVSLDVINGYDDISKVREMCSILEYMEKENRFVIRLNQDKLIFDNEYHSVTALSPSDYDSQEANKKFIAENIAPRSTVSLSAINTNPNHFSISLNIENKVTKKSILCGGDLEISKDQKGGWDAAIKSIKAPQKKAIQVFKVPHHGSETAFHKETWDHYTDPNVIAIITTYGSSSLPRNEYIEKFKTYTPNVVCTTKPKYNKKNVMSPSALKTLKKIKNSITICNVTPKDAFGFIIGKHSTQSITYTLHGDALLL